MSADLRKRNVNNNLPIIPTEVSNVNFTWKAGSKKYTYHFDQLQSSDETILKSPTVSIDSQGKVPQESKGFYSNVRCWPAAHCYRYCMFSIFCLHIYTAFSVFLPCVDNSSGIAMFSIGLVIKNSRGKSIPGTPLRLSLRKECAHRGVYDRGSLSSFVQGRRMLFYLH